MVDEVNVVGLILLIGGCLAIIYIFRLIRESRAKKLLNSPTNVKLYLAGSKKAMSDGIKVLLINGKKPIIGKDSGGNYVVLSLGDNVISAYFITFKHFVIAATIPLLAPLIINSKKKQGEVKCSVESGSTYILDFGRGRLLFTINKL